MQSAFDVELQCIEFMLNEISIWKADAQFYKSSMLWEKI